MAGEIFEKEVVRISSINLMQVMEAGRKKFFPSLMQSNSGESGNSAWVHFLSRRKQLQTYTCQGYCPCAFPPHAGAVGGAVRPRVH